MSREIGSLHFGKSGSRGKSRNRKILCLHTLSTLCPIDFELRLTSARWPLDTQAAPHPMDLRTKRRDRVEMLQRDPTSLSRA